MDSSLEQQLHLRPHAADTTVGEIAIQELRRLISLRTRRKSHTSVLKGLHLRSKRRRDLSVLGTGKTIAFRSSRSGDSEIWISNADGSNPAQLTSFGSPGILFPNWSADGQRLVFHAKPEGNGDLFSVAVSGGAPKRLTNDPVEDLLASYSRDGRWIYFSSNRSGRTEVWKIPADGGKATRVTTNGGLMPVESPDRKSVFYARLAGPEAAIWKIPVDSGEAKKVAGPIAKDVAFVASRQGIYFAAPPESSSPQLIHFLDFSTNRTRPVVVTEGEIGLGMSLSLDGRYLIFHNVIRSAAI
jgi:dipeptidyl aminopeptidase/acylaminoacyl peptidase